MKSRSHHHRLQHSDPPEDWVNGSWTVDCLCGVNFDDGEEMVNCDECEVWVHTRCSRYVKGNDMFVCDKCKIKNNRNVSEETEVAQLLVELPTKTVRIEGSYTNGASRQPPSRLWTDIPIEERVHKQGKPGGDPKMFGGLSSVFTPELWKCTGYVPKKFNFQYREFPCWDDKEGSEKLDEETENMDDKGAGVLFSLSKERESDAPAVAALVGLRGGKADRVACDRRKVCLKDRKKWDGENGTKKESSLLRSVVMHTGKRKKEDSGLSKDRIGRKKARAAEKEVDAKKRGSHSSKTVFTPTSDAKHLAFYEDRAQKLRKDDVQSAKSKKPRETAVDELTTTRHAAGTGNVKNHLKEISSADMNAEDCAANTVKKEDRVPGCSPKTDDAVCSVGDRDNAGKLLIKEEGDGISVSKLDGCIEVSDKSVGNSSLKDVTGTVEVKQNKVQDSNGDLQLKSEHSNIEVKVENLDNSSGSLLNVQSSPLGDSKDPGISSDHISETPKLNGTTVTSSQSSDHKAEDLDQSLEPASESHVNKTGQLLDDPCLLEAELEGTEGLMALQNSPVDRICGSAFPEEHSKPGGTASNFHAFSSHRKIVACTGKSSSTSTASLTPKSSTFETFKSANALNPNHIGKPQNSLDGHVNSRKDRASSQDGRDDNWDENPRRTVKDRPKPVGNPIPKPSNSSRISHDSMPKKTTAESKENVLSVSFKSSSPANTVPSHMYNRSSASILSHKGEKPNQPNFQPPKTNQNHVPSVCPPIASSSPATLSDEELALLLHQELNSSPRVPRVPRMRNAGSLPQLASPSPTSILMKRASNSGGKDHSSVPKRKYRDPPRDGFHSSREAADEPKRMDRVSSSHDPKRRDTDYTAEATTKEDNRSSAMESVQKNGPSTSAATNSGPSSSNEANDRNLSSIRSSPRNTSDDDTGTIGGPVHRTLPCLINDIMSKGRRMTYEELCNAVLPHWHNLRKHNGERYAYTSHSQAVLDCLRNRHEWARLVDRGPKTNSSKKRRKADADDSEDNDYGKGKASNQAESKSLESQKEDFPKGKRKARKRRRLALQGKGIKDIRKRRKQDRFMDEDFETSSNSSEDSVSSEDEIQGGGARPDGSEASSSSHEEETT